MELKNRIWYLTTSPLALSDVVFKCECCVYFKANNELQKPTALNVKKYELKNFDFCSLLVL